MAELSKGIPALINPSNSSNHTRIASSWFIRVMVACVTVIVGSAAWYAGRQSAAFSTSHIIADLKRSQDAGAVARMDLEVSRADNADLRRSIASMHNGTIVGDQAKIQDKTQSFEAEVFQLKAALAREESARSANGRLAAALGAPGVRLVPLKGVEAAAHSTAYSLLTENGHVVLVASGLPVPAVDRRYQLWLLRKEAPKISDGGIFSVEADGSAVYETDNASPSATLTGLEVTEEPLSGSAAPTATPILSASIEAGQQ
jgi:hypothetical protein